MCIHVGTLIDSIETLVKHYVIENMFHQFGFLYRALVVNFVMFTKKHSTYVFYSIIDILKWVKNIDDMIIKHNKKLLIYSKVIEIENQLQCFRKCDGKLFSSLSFKDSIEVVIDSKNSKVFKTVKEKRFLKKLIKISLKCVQL